MTIRTHLRFIVCLLAPVFVAILATALLPGCTTTSTSTTDAFGHVTTVTTKKIDQAAVDAGLKAAQPYVQQAVSIAAKAAAAAAVDALQKQGQ